MSENTNPMDVLLERLKIDLGIINNTVYDARLRSLLNVANTEVSKQTAGPIDLNDDRDAELVIDYAEWLWRNRREPPEIPKGLKFRLNSRAVDRAIPEVSADD